VEEARLFVDLGLLLAGALVGGTLAHFARQPLVVGYVLGGILVGPFTPGPTLSNPEFYRLFAEVGVVLLMFSIGVEFSIEKLLSVRKVALFGAPEAHRCLRTMRRMRPDLPILVRVNEEASRDRMFQAGATEVIQPETEAGLTIVRHSLDRLGVDHHDGRQYLERVRRYWSAAPLEEAESVNKPGAG
jgi:voltage-gated potassium channel Kch